MVALLAIPALGEWPDPATIVGIVAVSCGVLLANWPARAEASAE